MKDEQGKIDHIRKPGIEIGPGTLDIKNNEIYFYSKGEIIKGDLFQDLSKEENWIKFLDLKQNQKYVLKNDEEYPINIIKLKALGDNTFVFLSQNDGIGFLHNENLKLFK